MTTHYERLGVAIDADEQTIRSAYKMLIRIYHPDRAGPAGAAVAGKINEAKDVLCNAVRRAEYDWKLASESEARTRHTQPAEEPVKPRTTPEPNARPRPQTKTAPTPEPSSDQPGEGWRPEHILVSDRRSPGLITVFINTGVGLLLLAASVTMFNLSANTETVFGELGPSSYRVWQGLTQSLVFAAVIAAIWHTVFGRLRVERPKIRWLPVGKSFAFNIFVLTGATLVHVPVVSKIFGGTDPYVWTTLALLASSSIALGFARRRQGANIRCRRRARAWERFQRLADTHFPCKVLYVDDVRRSADRKQTHLVGTSGVSGKPDEMWVWGTHAAGAWLLIDALGFVKARAADSAHEAYEQMLTFPS